jgi:antirestriction protein ArdC
MAQSPKRRSEAGEPRDHYADVTAQIIAALEAGTPPWRRPWDADRAGGPTMPHNATTGARYRGINTLVLGMSPLAFMTCDPRWATYKQATDRGWHVRKGSRGTPGFFYKKIEIGDREGGGEDARKVIPLLRSFTLFHASQIEGIPPYVAPNIEEAPWREPEAAATIARNSRAIIRIGGGRAFYSPSTDHVQMPPTVAFRSPAAYASVLLHELGHWSGSKERLNRDLSGTFGSHDCDFTNGAAYIADWLDKLRDDKKEVFRAASDAQRIADYLLAFHPAYAQRTGGGDEEQNTQEPDASVESTSSTMREAA